MHRRPTPFKSILPSLLLLAFSILPFLPWLNAFFYYDDGTLLNLGQLTNAGNWQLAFTFAFIGHFRPLPILTTAAIYKLAGASSPIPYHLAALAIHALNVQLVFRLLRKLLRPALSLAAFFAALIFSIHWAGSEAITYFAAIGIPWSMLGGLIAAISAIRCLTTKNIWPWITFNLGLLISFGGGEYAVAALPFIAAAALIISLRRRSPRPRRTLFILALNALAWLGPYIAFEVAHQRAGRLGTEYSLGPHLFFNLNIDVARTSFPTTWINAPISFCLLTAIALALILYKILRPKALPLFFTGTLFFAAGILSSLPFAPSQMGNYLRFTYFGAAFFAGGQLLVFLTFARTRRSIFITTLFAGSALAAINLLQFQTRMIKLRPRLNAVRQTVLQTEQQMQNVPTAQLWFINADLQSVGLLLIARKHINPLHIHWTLPPQNPPSNQPQILIRSSWNRPYFSTTIEPSAATKTKQF